MAEEIGKWLLVILLLPIVVWMWIMAVTEILKNYRR